MKLRTLPILLCFFSMGFVDAMGPLAGTIQKQYALSGFMAGLLESREDRLKGLEYAKDLVDTMAALYDSMDDSLKFTGLKKEGPAAACAPATGVAPEEIKAPAPAGSDVFMDLRGVACPMNYVRAKLRMEEMELNQTIMLYLDEGAPIENVPVSLRNDGQEILKQEKTAAEHYEVLVRKLA